MLDRPVMMVYQQMALLPNISMQSVTPEHIYIYIYIKKDAFAWVTICTNLPHLQNRRNTQ